MSNKLNQTALIFAAKKACITGLASLSHHSVAALRQLLPGDLTTDQVENLYRAAQEENKANRLYEAKLIARNSPLLRNALRLGIASHTPGTLGLNGYEDDLGGRFEQYANPEDAASMLAPTAYLTELYREARKLHPESSPFHLDNRRPDLKTLILNQANMELETSALALAIEVLTPHAHNALNATADNFYEVLALTASTGNTPYQDGFIQLSQTVQRKDPNSKYSRENPQWHSLMSEDTRAVLQLSIAPHLYHVLTTVPNESNADTLYAEYFGELAFPEIFRTHLLNYFDLSHDEALVFDQLYAQMTVGGASKVHALQLNQLIRMYKAIGVTLEDYICLERAGFQSVDNSNADNLKALYLRKILLQQGVICSAEPGSCMGLLLSITPNGRDGNSLLDRLFGQIGPGPHLLPSDKTIDLSNDGPASAEKDAIKRTLKCDDLALSSLARLIGDTGSVTVDQLGLSRLYMLNQWANIHSLSVQELIALLEAGGFTQDFRSYKPSFCMYVWNSTLSLIEWLNKNKLRVTDLTMMCTTTYSPVLTPEVSNLINQMRNSISGSDATGTSERITVLAPGAAAALGLTAADVSKTLVNWTSQLTPLNTSIHGLWTYLLQGEDMAPTAGAVAFCKCLMQLTRIYTALGLAPVVLETFVARPQRLFAPDTEPPTVLGHDANTLRQLDAFNRWLSGLGAGASEVLGSFLSFSLRPQVLAQALQLEPERLQQAANMAKKFAQINNVETLYSWQEVDAIQQWLTMCTAYNVVPTALASLLQVYITSVPPKLSNWDHAARSLTPGLSGAQVLAITGERERLLSAALSSVIIQSSLRPGMVSNRESLYHWLLADNLNGPQIKTTRIADAIAALQTYINRAISGQELNADQTLLSSQFFIDWEMYNKRYSTWAGVSKLTLYPENYLDPTVRHGQTGMMNELLSKLGQSQLNTDTVGDAFNSYLNSFEEVANLSVHSGYHDNFDINQGKTYLIGENQNQPPDYYWRSADESKRSNIGSMPANAWSDWSKINAVMSPWASNVRPVMFKSRLYLCWLERRDMTLPNATTGQPGTPKVWEYSFSYSYLRYDGNWSSPRGIEVTTQITDLNLDTSDELGFFVSEYKQNETLVILLYKKTTSYAANQPSTAKGIYIFGDLSCQTFDATSLAQLLAPQLDTTTSRKVLNPYIPPGYGLSGGLYDKTSNTSTYIADGTAVACNVQENAIDAPLTLTLDRVSLTATFTGTLPNNPPLVLGILHSSVKTLLTGDWNVSTPQNIPDVFIIIAGRKAYYLAPPAQYSANAKLSASGIQGFTSTREFNATTAGYKVLEFDLPANFPSSGKNDTSLGYYVNRGIANEASSFAIEYGSYSEPSLSPSDIFIEVNDGIGAPQRFPLATHSDNPPAFTPPSTSYNFRPLTVNVSKEWSGSNVLKLDIKFVASGGSTTYKQDIVLSNMSSTQIMTLHTSAEGAQYLQKDVYRTRLNTLFARLLVERAIAGIDTILSLETQQIEEPELGDHFYVDATLPVYNPQVHGSKKEFTLYLAIEAPLTDFYPIYQGVLSSEHTTSIRLLLPVGSKDLESTYVLVRQFGDEPPDPESSGPAVFSYTPASHTLIVNVKGPFSSLALSPQNNKPAMDFSGANALYFWELFYYTPMLIAQRMLHEQRFSDATHWLSYIWNPNGYIVRGQKQNYFWNVRPLLEDTSWNSTPLDSVDPDAVAQYDPMHYKVATFFRALDILIGYGDAAYRKLERDTLNEAKGWYSQALNLLGQRPFIEQNHGWSPLSLEEAADETRRVAYQTALNRARRGANSPARAATAKTGNSLIGMFLPEVNGYLVNYWKTVELRLYNLRHNLSLDGQPLALPVYAAATDPKALLSAAVAASDGNNDMPSISTTPAWRFTPMLDSARAMVAQLIQFGGTLQGIIERQDAEEMNALLQNQANELMLIGLRQQDYVMEELENDLQTLRITRQVAQVRANHFAALSEENISRLEQSAMDDLSTAGTSTFVKETVSKAKAGLRAAPNIFGLGIVGGATYWAIADSVLEIYDTHSRGRALSAERQVQEEQYRRRLQDWALQREIAYGEVKQTDAQIETLNIRRRAIQLQKDYLIAQQEQMGVQLSFLQKKFSNKALYSWMRGRLATVYFQFYDLTVSRCLMAEKSWQWETGKMSERFIRAGAWQGTYAGLLCGENLMLNLAQMEHAWHQWYARSLEITRTVSLADFYAALATGSFNLGSAVRDLVNGTGEDAGTAVNGVALEPEQLVLRVKLSDLKLRDDYPAALGSDRRIKQISISLPVLVGPYQNIQAVLSYNGTASALLPAGCKNVALSVGINDSGLFHANMSEGLFMPFEGIDIDDGSLILSFPAPLGRQKQILESLNDVILHVNYTIIS